MLPIGSVSIAIPGVYRGASIGYHHRKVELVGFLCAVCEGRKVSYDCAARSPGWMSQFTSSKRSFWPNFFIGWRGEGRLFRSRGEKSGLGRVWRGNNRPATFRSIPIDAESDTVEIHPRFVRYDVRSFRAVATQQVDELFLSSS